MEGYVAQASELSMAREALAAALRDMMITMSVAEEGETNISTDINASPGGPSDTGLSPCVVSETEAEAVMQAFLAAYDAELSQVARETRLDTATLEGTVSCVNNLYDEWIVDADNAVISIGSQRWGGKRVRIFMQEGDLERHGPEVRGVSLSTRLASEAEQASRRGAIGRADSRRKKGRKEDS